MSRDALRQIERAAASRNTVFTSVRAKGTVAVLPYILIWPLALSLKSLIRHAARRRPAVHAPKILMTAAASARLLAGWLAAAPRAADRRWLTLCPFVITRRGLAR
jgi:hypothetical protein